jgi:hypothetical protein
MSVNIDDRNKKLLDISVDFLTKGGHGKYQKPHGVGDQDEVLSTFSEVAVEKIERRRAH